MSDLSANQTTDLSFKSAKMIDLFTKVCDKLKHLHNQITKYVFDSVATVMVQSIAG